jgi:hypothetical protein
MAEKIIKFMLFFFSLNSLIDLFDCMFILEITFQLTTVNYAYFTKKNKIYYYK